MASKLSDNFGKNVSIYKKWHVHWGIIENCIHYMEASWYFLVCDDSTPLNYNKNGIFERANAV